MSEKFKSLSLIFAMGYAISGLIFFVDLFLAFFLGNSVRYEEPNKIIALIELISAVLAFIILMTYFLNLPIQRQEKFQNQS